MCLPNNCATTSNIGRTHISPPCGHLSYLRRGLFTCISGWADPTPTKCNTKTRKQFIHNNVWTGFACPNKIRIAKNIAILSSRWSASDERSLPFGRDDTFRGLRSAVGRSYPNHPSYPSQRYKKRSPELGHRKERRH